MGDRDLIISQIRQRLEILYQMVEELEREPGPTPPGPGGTTDYNDLTNKPSIEGTTLSGNKTAAQLGLATSSSVSSITSRFEDLITPDNIEVEDNGELPVSVNSRLTLHQPLMLNHAIYYCYDESGVGYTYVALDTSGAYPKLSYAQIFKDNNRVHFYDYATDTVPASNSDNFITSGGVYNAIQGLATVARTGSYNDLSNKPTIPDVSDYYTKTQTDSEISDAIGNLALVARTGDYDDLENKPTIPAAQVNSDWNAVSGVAQILNKPTLGAAAAKGVDSSPTTSSTNLVESGGVATALAGKQASLSTAQINATNSGITAAKVAQYDKDSAALPDVVDRGAKNLLDITAETASQRTTTVDNGNGSITISCSSATWATRNVVTEVAPGTYKAVLDVDQLVRNGNIFALFINESDDGETWNQICQDNSITSTGERVYDITISKKYVKVNTNINNSGTSASGSATIRFMLCTTEDWAVSQKFVPYCPSMAELYKETCEEETITLTNILSTSICDVQNSSLVVYRKGKTCIARLSVKIDGTLTGNDEINTTAMPTAIRPKFDGYFAFVSRDAGGWASANLASVVCTFGTNGKITIRSGTNAASAVYIVGTATWFIS